MAGPITLGGLGSGLDTNGIVTALVGVENQPITAMQQKQTDLQSASSIFSTFSTNLGSLRTAAADLSSTSGFSSYSASSSDASIVATTSGGALPGAYSVNVTQLAKEQRTYSDPQSSSTSALGLAGTLQLSIGASTVNVSVASGDSLTGIAAKISSSGARVSASVVYDGTNYLLQVRGLDTGAANAVNMTETGFSLGLLKPANTYQSAQDAKLTVDGIAVTRPTNQITGVISGVTLAVTQLSTTPATINVATNSSALKTKITTLLNAYNAMVKTAHAATGYGSAKAANQYLAGDQTMRSSLDQLSRVLTSQVPGTSGAYQTLASIGLSSTRDGNLTFDATKFDTALTADATGVARLFVTDTSSGATGAMKSLTDKIASLVDLPTSPVTGRISSFGTTIRHLSDSITAAKNRVSSYETQLRAQFANLDKVVSAYKAQQSALSGISSGTGTGTL